jgi:hypothetical protein
MHPAAEVRRDISVRFTDLRRILVRIGYKKSAIPDDDPILGVVREEAVRAAALIQPAAAWAVIDAAEADGHPVFADAVRVAFCVNTIGPGLEDQCAAYFACNDDLRGMALDALGSEAVGQVSRHMDRLLAERGLESGLWPSKRYAPGYKGWDVGNQALLFSKVPAAEIGVRLTDSFMMVPRKSYSFRVNYYADRSLTTRRFPLPEL